MYNTKVTVKFIVRGVEQPSNISGELYPFEIPIKGDNVYTAYITDPDQPVASWGTLVVSKRTLNRDDINNPIWEIELS